MTLQKWIKDRAIHGFPTFSIEDVRDTGMYSSEQIVQNELYRLCSNKTIASVYRGFYVIVLVQYILRGSVPATYYIDQLMAYLNKPHYVCMLSAAELLGAAHQRPQQFSVMTTFPKRRVVSTSRNCFGTAKMWKFWNRYGFGSISPERLRECGTSIIWRHRNEGFCSNRF